MNNYTDVSVKYLDDRNANKASLLPQKDGAKYPFSGPLYNSDAHQMGQLYGKPLTDDRIDVPMFGKKGEQVGTMQMPTVIVAVLGDGSLEEYTDKTTGEVKTHYTPNGVALGRVRLERSDNPKISYTATLIIDNPKWGYERGQKITFSVWLNQTKNGTSWSLTFKQSGAGAQPEMDALDFNF